MRHLVLYDAVCPEVAAAVAGLRDTFELREMARGVPRSAVHTVVLVGAATPDPGARERARVIGIVDPAVDGRWPEHWYGLIHRGASPEILVRAIRNAFADLEAATEIRRLQRELSRLNAIGIRLTAERHPDVLLDMILSSAREITESDAGSLYLVQEAPDGTRELYFVLAQNDSIEVPFRATTLPLTSESVAGHVALTGTNVNLVDAYEPPPGSPYQINRTFDQRTGYRTKSMLVVPMHTPQGETIGVLQLINCRPGYTGRLMDAADVERWVRPFGPSYETLAESLASQAAVAVDNNRLYESIQRLFEGFVGASVTAIESRDPTTSGHSFRVADLTVGLAEIVDRSANGRYGSLRFSREEMRELRYAALLHDFGKVGVREHILLKSKKLYPVELERIRQRVSIIKRGLELRVSRQKIDYLLANGPRGYDAHAAALDADLAATLADLDANLARIVMANEPAVLPQNVIAHIRALVDRYFEDEPGRRHAVITPEEAEVLAISRGSLTSQEFREIQEHVVHTFQFLEKIPWTKELRRIPEIARAHHEKLDGSGYPNGMRGEEIPVQSRMMTIADMFDALTAGDRPYKRAVPVDEALDILRSEERAGRLDAALLHLFIDAKVFEITRPPGD